MAKVRNVYINSGRYSLSRRVLVTPFPHFTNILLKHDLPAPLQKMTFGGGSLGHYWYFLR